MEKAPSTRQKALDVALELFALRGYAAVSMADIADVLGIKAPSLYKHFSGKEALFHELATVVGDYFLGLWAAVQYQLERLEQETVERGHLTAQALEGAAGWFFSALEDPRTRYCRLLALRDLDGGELWLWGRPLALYEDLFTKLIEREILRRGDPHVMAVEYIAPLQQLLFLQDRRLEAGGGAEAAGEEARRHIRQFHRIFAHRERQGPSGGVSRLFRR